MSKDQIDLGASDILRFVGRQLGELEEDLRRIEGAILTVTMANSSDRHIIQNLDRSLQVLQDLSRLCAGVSEEIELKRIDADHASAYLRLGHLKVQLSGPKPDSMNYMNEPEFFD